MRHDVPLREHTTLGLGGPASHFLEVDTDEAAKKAIEWASSESLPVFPLGGGSNLVVADAGLRGLTLKLTSRGYSVKADGEFVLVTVEAGHTWHEFVEATVAEGWAGLECLGGIPGNVGATPIQNVGAYGQEVGETISRVVTLDRTTLELVEFTSAQLDFSYRNSFLKSGAPGRYLVLRVEFRLRPGGSPKIAYGELKNALAESSAPTLREVFATVVELRKRKSMVLSKDDVNRRSCGSFFVNVLGTDSDVARIQEAAGEVPPTFPAPNGLRKIAAAWLIERAGFSRGHRAGHVGLSTKHTLALVAHDGATTSELLAFSRSIQETVRAKFGVELEREPVLWE